MRSATLALCLALLVPDLALAQPSPVTATQYSTSGTELGKLMDNPQAKAVLQKHVPELLASEQVNMARGMTLKALQQYAPTLLTDDKLTQIDQDLGQIQPAK